MLRRATTYSGLLIDVLALSACGVPKTQYDAALRDGDDAKKAKSECDELRRRRRPPVGSQSGRVDDPPAVATPA
jgi:hypothetical protein